MNLADIEFAGAVPHCGISRFYEQADIFINASCLDNMPISILEAFASGTPVVSTAQEGIRYMIEHERTGLLCETGDWHGLTENVGRLLREPVLASQIARNALEESNRYRWNVVRGKWLEVYQALEQSSVVTHDSEKMVAADAK
jgi:glycosyltransferase involved in cell wall biosynthesis